MALKRSYEIGESSKPLAITAEAKARRQAYLEMRNNLRNPNREVPENPIPPPTLEESDSTTTPVPPSAELPQSLNDDSKAKIEEGYIITSTGERTPFKWGKCIGIGPDPEEEEEEEEEDLEEGDLEMNPEDTPIGEQQEDAEESEEGPKENFEEKVEEQLEEEEEVEIMEEDTEEEWEPMESNEDEDPWEIPSGDEEILDENLDEGNVDEPEAIERAPEEREVSDSEYKGFSNDDDLC